jgi:hypothetical protein
VLLFVVWGIGSGAAAGEASTVPATPSAVTVRTAWHDVSGYLVGDSNTVVARAPQFDQGRPIRVAHADAEVRATGRVTALDRSVRLLVVHTEAPIWGDILQRARSRPAIGDRVFHTCGLSGPSGRTPALCETWVKEEGRWGLVLAAPVAPDAAVLDRKGGFVGIGNLEGEVAVHTAETTTRPRDVVAPAFGVRLGHTRGGAYDHANAQISLGGRFRDTLGLHLVFGMGAPTERPAPLAVQDGRSHGFARAWGMAVGGGAELSGRVPVMPGLVWPVSLEVAVGAHGWMLGRTATTTYVTDDPQCRPLKEPCPLRVSKSSTGIERGQQYEGGATLGGGVKVGPLDVGMRWTPGALALHGHSLQSMQLGLGFP